MGVVLILLVAVPLGSGVVALLAPLPVTRAVTVAAGIACFALAVSLVGAGGVQEVRAARYLRVDALSVVFLLATAFLYAGAAAYAVGYVTPEKGEANFPRYARRFYAGLNVFAASMLAAPLVNGLALLWVAVEVTTVVSALLVAIEDTDEAAEAAWKYVLLASAGLGIALLATIVMYYAGSQVLGASYELTFDPLLAAAGRLPHGAVQLAFVLAVVGFGTKVGLVPLHTWLPDAHSEAPTPVSALLSGSLLVVSFYAVLRYYQVTRAAVGGQFPQTVLLVFGVASLLLAALYLLDQHDVKRLLAYSSVEHMGILAVGVGFGAPLALAGVLLHVLAHAAAKGNAFFGAGVLVRKFGTKSVTEIRGALDALPWTAPLFLLAVLALSAFPPFGLFRSEFQIVAGGMAGSAYALTAVLVVLVTVAFFGLSLVTTRMVFLPGREPPSAQTGGVAAPPAGEPGAAAAAVTRSEPSRWMVAPMVAGLAALVMLGVHPPGDLTELLSRAVTELEGLG